MNKKIVSLLLVLGLATTLGACQEGPSDSTTSPSPTTSPTTGGTTTSPAPTKSP
ncbi:MULTISPECIES: hypothetical protein [unclassified Coleofasciculus]|uniref:hypothetical protein n=1 Tax=Cyanophyceae TaxID=3028117 RepID=UPI001689AB9E|nr:MULTISPECIES: hypothetical protein [unclassified Coleofasciculus]MBD1890139.1 hypothetical protein [Coleofasciculus sp. FACHB-SPT9]MBD1894357.1 hypothetical protein [Coleofasciculus sp. FACHB-129]MBD2084926.1 hypothetical protein [Coleofasciculus sp. FACHB-542]